MFAKQVNFIYAVAIGAALVAVGCADGQRQNKGRGKRLLRNPDFKGSGGVAGAGRATPQNPAGTTTTPPTLPTAAAGDEKEITACFDELTSGASAEAKLPTGTFGLVAVQSHVKATSVNQGNAEALTYSALDEQGLKDERSPLGSGTFAGADDGRTLDVAQEIEVDANGVVKATPGSEAIIESRLETKGGKTRNVVQLGSNVAPASLSLLQLLQAPSREVKDAAGKPATLKIKTLPEGGFVLWISIEEKTVSADGKQGDSLYRNYFLNFAKPQTPPPAATPGN